MGDGQTEPHTTLNVEVPAYKYAAPKNPIHIIVVVLIVVVFSDLWETENWHLEKFLTTVFAFFVHLDLI